MDDVAAPTKLSGSSQQAREPETGFVDVRDEPQHHHRFENEFVRVYDVRFAPGESSLYHRHSKDTMYVTVFDTKVYDHTFQTEEDQAQTHELPLGLSLCRPHASEPLTHKVRNVGEGLMHMIGAEVKKLPEVVASAPLSALHHAQMDTI